MKKILLVCLVMLFGVTRGVFAQNLEEVVHLKNGSVIRGIVVEQIPNESIKIQTRDGNLFVYRMDEIQKIAKEQSGDSYLLVRNQSFDSMSSGYFGIVNFGYEIGVGGGDDRIKLDVVNGYRILPEFSIGAGVGVKYYTDADVVTIPVYVHLRTDLLRRKATPFIALNTGYNISTYSSIEGGALVEPSVGVGIRLNNSKQLNVSLGYSLNCFKAQGYNFYYNVISGGYFEPCEVKIQSQAIMLHLGFMW